MSYLPVSQCSSHFLHLALKYTVFLGVECSGSLSLCSCLVHLFQHHALLSALFTSHCCCFINCLSHQFSSMASLFHSHNHTSLQLCVSVFDTNHFSSQRFLCLKLCAPTHISKWTTGHCLLFADCWPAHQWGHIKFFHQLYNQHLKLSMSYLYVNWKDSLTFKSFISTPCSMVISKFGPRFICLCTSWARTKIVMVENN